MYILGLATMGESAAALLKDGVLVAAVEEERLTRRKHEGCFPIRAIRYCLESQGINLADVDHVAVYWQPWRVGTRLRGVLRAAVSRPRVFAEKVARSLETFGPAGGGEAVGSDGSWSELFRVRARLERSFGPTKAKLHYLDHHRSHVASSFLASPFEESVVVTFDGGGESVSTLLGVGRGTGIETLRSFDWPNSLGHFYSAFTGFLGFQMLDGEYKMMGLAPYGRPRFVRWIRENVLISDRPGSYRLNTDLLDYHEAFKGRFSRAVQEALGPARDPEGPFTQHHEDIAASVQAAFEEVVTDLTGWAYDQTGIPNLSIAGGCGLNCTANGKLLRQGPFKQIFVPPAPHDAGGSVGAALLCHHEVLKQPRHWRMTHGYYGPAFDQARIASALAARGLSATVCAGADEVVERTADVLAAGGVAAWFQGRAEFGPRALGARSFLADPRDDAIRDTINEKIKKRELFRPFAPSVKAEAAGDFFDLPQASPFMNLIGPVREDKRGVIPAVTHVDGTARVHTVTREANERYWMLLDAFERRTGVPVLLNTSFNIHEPIVCTPEEAIDCFLRSKVDVLVLGEHMVYREALGREAAEAQAVPA